MYCVACLFYYQYAKNDRIEKEEEANKNKKSVEPQIIGIVIAMVFSAFFSG
jgi:hypothetical protein